MRGLLPALCLASLSMVGCSQGLSAFGEFEDADLLVDTGSQDSFNDDEPDEVQPDEEPEEEQEETEVSGCTYEGFDSKASQTTLNTSNANQMKFVHRSVNVQGYPNDELQLVSFQGSPYYGPSQPGSYSVEGLNMSDSGRYCDWPE